MRKIALIIFAFASVLLTGCAVTSPLTGASYGRTDVRVEQRVRLGTVFSVREVDIEGSGTVGTIAGGLLGGIAGNSMGGGSGKKLLTVLGALGGAVAGNAIEKGATELKGVEITIRLENGELVAITQGQDARQVFRKGDQVRIVGSGRSSRVDLI